jgi:AraC-like DNA-binding protein
MNENGVITGYADGAFKPDKGVTKAEFVSMLKEIGGKVGFLNASYFVTWYKKHTRLAPTEYRKRTDMNGVL